jgi:geranylgeranyl reductase
MLRLPRRLIQFSFSKIRVRTSSGEHAIPLSRPFSIHTVDRQALGQWQLDKAQEAGAIVRTRAEVTGMGKDSVAVNGRERIKFSSLVGADGSSSLVRRHLGIPTKDMGMAIQYIVPGDAHSELQIFFDAKLFGTWYAWIFPHKGFASIGCGSDPRIIPAGTLRRNFGEWLEREGIDCSNGRYEGFPINFDYRGHAFGNVFLAGDAAGLASGLTGEGMHQALVSGEEVAMSIMDRGHRPEMLNRLLGYMKEENDVLRQLSALYVKKGPVPQIEEKLLALFSEQGAG